MAPPRFPVEVIVTPRFDLFYALHALSSEAPTPLGGWKENAARRLPRGFAEAARRVAPIPIFWPLLADALQGTAGEMTFQQMLSALKTMRANELRANILGGIFHQRSTVHSLLAGKKTLAQVLTDEDNTDTELLAHFGLRPYRGDSPAAQAMSTLMSDATSYREELSEVLRTFWQSGFRADWELLDESARTEAARIRSLAERNSIADVASALRLPVVFDDASGAMRTKSGTVVKREQIERCYLIPSAFNTRRWWAKYEAGGDRVALYFPVWTGAEAASALAHRKPDIEKPARATTKTRVPNVNPEAVFRALGDTTRYAIASLLARKPTTSAELSRSLNVSKPTITHHVQALRAAGLITEEADGGSSRLSLNRDTVAALSDAAVRDLFSSTGELQLLTTRHRRGGPNPI